MNITNKTILVTAGGSGIGYATAKYLSEKGNKVIISGRNAEKIEKAGKELGLDYIPCDVTDAVAVNNLVNKLESEYADLSVLINNAGVANLYKLGEGAGAFEKSKQEFETNYFGPVRLTEALLPLLKKQQEAAIVNITSNVSFHPLVVLPTYSDTKAALHSHTVALRLTLSKETNIKLFEVMPSLINTDATKEMGGEQHGLPPSVVAEDIFNGIEEDRFEIYVGETGRQWADYFANPVAAVENFNQGLFKFILCGKKTASQFPIYGDREARLHMLQGRSTKNLDMEWYNFIAAFFSGAFMANTVPHFVHGISGNKFPTPFATPRGIGLSSSTLNVFWSLFNFAAGWVTFVSAHIYQFLSLQLACFAGFSLMALILSKRFQSKHRE